MVEFVNLSNADALDRYVATHPKGHFMQSSLWGRVKQDWQWQGLILREESGAIRGTMALLRHNLRYLQSCLLYAPRGPIFSPGDDAAFRALIAAASEYGRRCGAYLLRIDPEIPDSDAAFAALSESMGFHICAASDFSLFQPRMCYVSDLRGLDEHTLEQHFRRSTRYNIHHALKGPLTVRLGGAEDLPAFFAMMEQTGAKNGFRPRPLDYYRAILEQMGRCARLYLAELEGSPVAGAITVTFGKTCSFFYSCSDPGRQRLHANELLLWQILTDALHSGCDRLDFRGVEGFPEEGNPKLGLHLYKQGFGADFHSYVGQMDLVLRPWVARVMGAAERLA